MLGGRYVKLVAEFLELCSNSTVTELSVLIEYRLDVPGKSDVILGNFNF